ncbi:phage baseplate assembly protein V [Epilithonimonas sp. JDS]|uniref:type VI secretion system Vgr family protein n=1 Tax=Epilithonimonas sp. JDS TaxID=2902797 RepID=UPI001E2970B5|nr:phage baseplate assembly protein V [Epilithonimonas sp. JDS]MCD9853282.1 phage baseplate assembly protein V [Epilithonimonas sp. JDS]
METPNTPVRPTFKPDNSANSISASQIFGINRLVKLNIVIEGKVISHYKNFTLSQNSGKHHEFELVLAHDTLGGKEDHNLESSHEFLGKRITVVQKYKDIPDSPERTFVGVITKVGFSQEKGGLPNIVLGGYSPTILLDSAPTVQSFGGESPVSLSIIASQLIKEGLGSSKYDVRIDANDYSEIPFSVQYNETHYNYLARMAEAYGEQFYYDGEVLHFGKLPPQNPPLKLIYGSNVSDIRVELKAVHTKPEFYGYNSSQHSKLTSGETQIKHKSDLAKTAYSKTQTDIFQTRSLQVAPIKATTDKDVVNSQESTAGSKAVEVFTVSGNISIPFLYPGCVADLEMRKPDSNQTSYFTRIMVTEATHDVDTLGHYHGTFKAIASDTGFLPKPHFEVPAAQPQIATVISNTDPQGQGRVIVKFDWQLHDTTNFIRMMSPDAGGTDQITQNRGYVAIPEVGDQVMVGFVHNHPDRPFVMGGMFHGQVGLGGGVNNHMRSIQTKSGIRVLMNDDEKSVTILDPSGNTYFMDGAGNITVTAPNDINFNAGANMNISVGQNMTTTVGANQTNTIGMNKSDTVAMNFSENVGAMKNVAVGASFMTNVIGKLIHYVKGDMETFAEKEHKLTSLKGIEVSSKGNVEHHAEKEVKNNSGEKSKNH